MKDFAAMCHRIALKDLPATFRDAVLVCRKMQVRFLWIDALCIIQDNLDDWKDQAVQMGDYYRRSELTIAVHSATSDSVGFLADVLQLQAVQRGPYHLVSLQSDFFAEVDCSALSHRGWVLQERLLSLRILHFTQHHLYCEDSRRYLADDHPASELLSDDDINKGIQKLPVDLPVVKPPIDAAVALAETLILKPSDLGQEPQQDIANLWPMVVERYTSCELTRPTDKLPAVTGIAKYIQTWTEEARYYAGIWSNSLVQGLLWAATETSLTRFSDSRAPSWSWASTDGQVQFLKESTRASLVPEMEFVQIGALDGASDPHWINGPASLTLRTAIKRVEQFGWERNSIEPGNVPGRLVGQVDFSFWTKFFRRKPFMRKVYWAKSDDRWGAPHGGWIVPDEDDEEHTPYSLFRRMMLT